MERARIVSYPVAILAQEKGFNWMNQEGFEDPDDTLMYWLNVETQQYECHSTEYLHNISDKFTDATGACFAPTQSLLQKWYREQHGLHPHICYLDDWKWNVDVYKWKEENGLMTPPGSGKGHTSYELALDYGLLQMGKLI